MLSDDEVDRIFQALADATRRDIVSRVIRHEQSVSQLAARYAMSFAAVQKHVAVLERAALVAKERRGREQIVRGNVDTVGQANELLAGWQELWWQRARRIDDILASDDEQGGEVQGGEEHDDDTHDRHDNNPTRGTKK